MGNIKLYKDISRTKIFTIEPVQEILVLIASASKEGSVEYMHRLTRAFTAFRHKIWM